MKVGVLIAALFMMPTVSLAGPIECLWHREGWLISSTGPCETFTPPTAFIDGATFMANGQRHVIGIVQRNQLDKDMTVAGSALKVGQWFCSAAETEHDFPADDGQDHLWLVVAPCF